MKRYLPLLLVTLLLCGCPDARLPKPPSKAPEPKAVPNALYAPIDLPIQNRMFQLTAT